jgi:trans-aconitate 2-methyltransferase
MTPVGEWDATGYQRISVPHEEWAAALMERLPLVGGETVLDAGCGSGRVTRMLVERLPEGRIVAVDGSAAMVEKVREVIRPGDEAFVADLTALELPEPVDAIVSSAVFHWIPDHDALFARMRGALKPGGRIEAQCGGARQPR